MKINIVMTKNGGLNEDEESIKCQYKNHGNKKTEILMVPVDEQIGGAYRRLVRTIYKVVSRGIVSNLLEVFRKRIINGRMTISFVKHCEEKDSR